MFHYILWEEVEEESCHSTQMVEQSMQSVEVVALPRLDRTAEGRKAGCLQEDEMEEVVAAAAEHLAENMVLISTRGGKETSRAVIVSES